MGKTRGRQAARAATIALAVWIALAMIVAPASAQQIPPAPDPVAVTLDGSTTAILVLDVNEGTCRPTPNCMEMVPRIASLVASARAAGATIVYATGGGGAIMPEALPLADDPIISRPSPSTSTGSDRFYGSPMDTILRTNHITTIVIVGWRANGSVMYTA